MQTIEELADCFFTKYSEEAIKNDSRALSSTMYHKRLCEQVRQMVEFHVTEALRIADKKAEYEFPEATWWDIDDKDFILNAYPLENIK